MMLYHNFGSSIASVLIFANQLTILYNSIVFDFNTRSSLFLFLDLIQLKSPSSPNPDSNTQLPGTVPTRRRSAECGSSSPPYYAENERVHHLATIERLNTVVTPTATSFSREDLNEIFNITRDTMDNVKTPAGRNANNIDDSTLADDSVEMQSPDKHNIAIDESNFSLDSTLTETFSAAPMSELLNNDDNNNQKLHEQRTPTKQTLDSLDTSSTQSMAISTPSPISGCSAPLSSPQTPGPAADSVDGGIGSRTGSLSKLQMVCREIFMTEKSYVSDLQAIIEVNRIIT